MLVQDKVRQIAIVLSLADRARAEVWLNRLPAEDALRIRDGMHHLGHVSDEEYRLAIASVSGILARQDSGSSLNESISKDDVRSARIDTPFKPEKTDREQEHVSGHSEPSNNQIVHPAATEEEPAQATIDTIAALETKPLSTRDLLGQLNRAIMNFDAVELKKHLTNESPTTIAALMKVLQKDARHQVVSLLSTDMAVAVFPLFSRMQQIAYVVVEELRDFLLGGMATISAEPGCLNSEALQSLRQFVSELSAEERFRFLAELAERDSALATELSEFTASECLIESRPIEIATSVECLVVLGSAGEQVVERELHPSIPTSYVANFSEEVLRGEGVGPANPISDCIPFASPSVPMELNIRWEEIFNLSDVDLGKVVRSVRPERLLQILKVDSSRIRQRILNLFPSHEQQRIIQRIESLQPVADEDFRRAIRELESVAGRLFAQGQIATLYNLTVTSAA